MERPSENPKKNQFCWNFSSFFSMQISVYQTTHPYGKKRMSRAMIRRCSGLGRCCHGHLSGQSFVSSGYGRGLLQDEDQSLWESSSFVPWLVHNAFRDVSGVVPEWSWSSGFMRKSSIRTNAPIMWFSVLLNSSDNFFVTLPSISSETWVM